ncbi:hypothetical protein QUF63_07915 [Anaerolineales bacterium HSG25]|nr:hypothetical protein [Anaerolineales bacterium HSG25]
MWQQQILTYYPQAKPSEDVRADLLQRLENEFGGDRKQTLLATSICVDEVNFASIKLQQNLDAGFVLGGLAGYPFVGRTGMSAYAHHVPDDGTAFIFYGPHIGITPQGTLGALCRRGQAKTGNSCGALMLALLHLQANPSVSQVSPTVEAEDDDLQQAMLVRWLTVHRERILTAKLPQHEITEVAYELIHQQIHALITATRAEFHCARIVLAGGILINTGPTNDDWVDLRHVQVV